MDPPSDGASCRQNTFSMPKYTVPSLGGDADYQGLKCLDYLLGYPITTSILESPPRILIPIPVAQLAHLLDLSRDPLPPRILPPQHPIQDPRHQDIRHQVPQREAVAQYVARPVVGTVQLGAQDGAAVPYGDLHGVGDGALRLARDIDGGPRERQGRGRVDSPGREEGPEVGYPRAPGGVGVGQQDDVAYGSEGGRAGHEDGALVQPLGEDGYRQGRDEGEGVRGDGQQLCVGGGVPEAFDYGWLVLSVLRDDWVYSLLGAEVGLTHQEERIRIQR